MRRSRPAAPRVFNAMPPLSIAVATAHDYGRKPRERDHAGSAAGRCAPGCLPLFERAAALDLVANAARQRREPAIALRPTSVMRSCGSFSFFVPTVS
jgi:hypothetical protein